MRKRNRGNHPRIIYRDKSSLPSEIKRIYYRYLKEYINLFFNTNEIFNPFKQIIIEFSDLNALPDKNIYRWFAQACLHIDKIESSLHTPVKVDVREVNNAKFRIIINVSALLYYNVVIPYVRQNNLQSKNSWELSESSNLIRQYVDMFLRLLSGESVKSKLATELIHHLRHESTHVIHAYENSDLYETSNRRRTNLGNIYKKLPEKERLKKSYVHFLALLSNISFDYMKEGIAEYAVTKPEPVYSNLATIHSRAYHGYLKVYPGIKDIIEDRKELTELLNKKEIDSGTVKKVIELTDSYITMFRNAFYPIGFHIVYTLRFKFSLKDILKFNRRKFYTEYERICISNNLRPIISYKSKDGYLDLTTFKAEMKRYYKSFIRRVGVE